MLLVGMRTGRSSEPVRRSTHLLLWFQPVQWTWCRRDPRISKCVSPVGQDSIDHHSFFQRPAVQLSPPLEEARLPATLAQERTVGERIPVWTRTVPAAWSSEILKIQVIRFSPEILVQIFVLSLAIIERRCCWSACGPSNAVSSYNGVPTYFCSGDRCNGIGSENNLAGPSEIFSSKVNSFFSPRTSVKTTTYSSGTCRLNCQNGGTPETEDGCFCYCNENTSGRECEQSNWTLSLIEDQLSLSLPVDCTQTNVDGELCRVENRPLCDQSEIYPYQCLRLCGKC